MKTPTTHSDSGIRVEDSTSATQTDPIEEYRHQRRAFHLHAATFAGSVAIMFLINLVLNLAAGTAGEWGAWWSAWALLGWGIGITVHGLVVRLARPEGFQPA